MTTTNPAETTQQSPGDPTQQARYTRIYADERGESHFADLEIGLSPIDFAPPAEPMNVGAFLPTSRSYFVGGLGGWSGEAPHPSPRRQIFCILRGELAVTTSDGNSRHFVPGDVVLCEDTTGQGHATLPLDGQEFLMLGIALAD